MAKTKKPLEKIPSELLIPKDEAILKLNERIVKGKELLGFSIINELQLEEAKKEYRKWNDYNHELLQRIFSTSEEAEKYKRVVGSVISMGFYAIPLSTKIDDHTKAIKEKLHRLDSLLDRLDLISISLVQNNPEKENSTILNNKVFIVHGRDDLAKTSLEILLHEMGLETIVLHRQADEGQTIIEKFEKHSDVGYAFILLTPDEIAYLANEDSLSDDERQKEKRARPNVIFEFGYFVGKLTRQRVCCLYTGRVTVSGLIYKEYHKHVKEVAWDIQKDLKAVGIIN